MERGLRLLHDGNCLGEVSAVTSDHPWMVGRLSLSSDDARYREFFSFMTSEEGEKSDGPPLPSGVRGRIAMVD
jgi:hypothetical protein